MSDLLSTTTIRIQPFGLIRLVVGGQTENEQFRAKDLNRAYSGLEVENLPKYLQYQAVYFAETAGPCHNLIVTAMAGANEIARLPLLLFPRASSHLVLSPWALRLATFAASVPASAQIAVNRLMLEEVIRYAKFLGTTDIVFEAPLGDEVSAESLIQACTSGWSHHKMTARLSIDLTQGMQPIFANLRKKTRQQVRKYGPVVEVNVSNSVESVFRLQDLHRQVSGRTTRSGETWEIQANAAASNQGFTVLAQRADGILIGGLYVMHSDSHALAFSAAYNRDAMDQGLPLGHLCELRAMSYLGEELGVGEYTTLSVSNETLTDSKLSRIAHFKEGLSVQHHLWETIVCSI